jgi:hypothetical protein
MPDRTADFAAEILKNGADLKIEIAERVITFTDTI